MQASKVVRFWIVYIIVEVQSPSERQFTIATFVALRFQDYFLVSVDFRTAVFVTAMKMNKTISYHKI